MIALTWCPRDSDGIAGAALTIVDRRLIRPSAERGCVTARSDGGCVRRWPGSRGRLRVGLRVSVLGCAVVSPLLSVVAWTEPVRVWPERSGSRFLGKFAQRCCSANRIERGLMVSVSSYLVGSGGVRRFVAVVGLIATMFALVLVSVASPARAADDCGAQGATTTCKFRSTGAQDTFVVPAGVTSIQVAAVGAPGAVGGLGVAPPVALLG